PACSLYSFSIASSPIKLTLSLLHIKNSENAVLFSLTVNTRGISGIRRGYIKLISLNRSPANGT
ncbi:MAG: hypothetical protein ACTSWY_03030, partial [Promethearchaeota archaeon]